MRIALLGGTGDVGAGLALRWGHDTNHELLVGSRDPERAREASERYAAAVADRDREATVKGFDNAMVTDRADVAVLCVPAYHVADTVASVASGLDGDTVVVTPAAGTRRDDEGVHSHPPSAGSVAALVRGAVPDEAPVVGAFHTLAASRLADLDAALGVDTLVFGDDDDAKATVARLAEEIDGLRALDAGGLASAPEVEATTPLLVNVAANDDDVSDPGIRFS
ncbi:NADPH-dependent F420 reductase [Candidatus Halobonum tyrrellensis]|uniref:NADPH-dependent F420 reductase n=1 Tax=Candidatus Halobonum tyrrellensis G22 TaxID=1324957 RepID=V4HIB7_9EURY|nr:NADPH-dependent F420 reductase [Candidatus Halobonum tyrrellensis]ESP87664.1 NADPH-dependent F420 reductase [Candidatus Halobonum tyrrellensis G22]